MTSKILSINLLRDDFKRRIGCFLVMSLAFFILFPVSTLLVIDSAKTIGDLQCYSKLYTYMIDMTVIMTMITIVGAFICAFSGFGYLFSKKEVDFYHSIPIKRETLFCVRYINGILYFSIPYAINICLSLLLIAIKGEFDGTFVSVLIQLFFFHVANFLLIYTITIVAVFLTGRAVMSAIISFSIMLYIPCIAALIDAIVSRYYYSICSWDTGITDVLMQCSPIVSYGNYTDYITGFSVKSGVEEAFRVGVTQIGGTLIATGLFIVLAIFLYRIRPSEAAERSIAFPKMKAVIRVLFVLPLSVASGYFFHSIVGYDSNGWYIFGILSGFLFFNFIIELIFNNDIHSIVLKKKQLAICFGLVILLSVFARGDILGYNSYIPAIDQIESVTVNSRDFVTYPIIYFNTDGSEEENSGSEVTITDIVPIYKIIEQNENTNIQCSEWSSEYYVGKFSFELKSGKIVERYYYFKQNIDEKLTQLIFSSEGGKQALGRLEQLKEQDCSQLCIQRSNPTLDEISDYTIKLSETEQKLFKEVYEKDVMNFTYDEFIHSFEQEADIYGISIMDGDEEKACIEVAPCMKHLITFIMNRIN